MKDLLKGCAIAACVLAICEGIIALLSGMSVSEYLELLAGSLAFAVAGGFGLLVFINKLNEREG